MIKQNKRQKQYFGKALKFVGLAFLTSSIFVSGCMISEPELSLPHQNDAKERLMQIYKNEDEMYLPDKQGYIYRHPYKENASIKINLTFQPTDFQKIIFQDSLEEFNDVFDVINPNYKFILNCNPTQQDLLDPYNIDVEIVDYIEDNSPAGFITQGINISSFKKKDNQTGGGAISDSSIKILKSIINDSAVLMHVFKHEFFHSFGVGDAYQNPNATQNTIMQAEGITSLTSYDVAFIDALYRNPDNIHTEDEINTYIRNYEKTNVHTYENTLIPHLKKLLSEVDVNTFGTRIMLTYFNNYNSDISKLIQKMKGMVENGLEFDEDFGLQNFNFAEIPTSSTFEKRYYTYLQFKDNSAKSVLISPTANVYKEYSTKANKDGILFLSNNVYIKIDDCVLKFAYNQEKLTPDYNVFKITDLTAEEYFENLNNNSKHTKTAQKANIDRELQ